jgi:hypothetical protein
MNARCYRCGWSFSLSREAIAAAVTAADVQGDKYHVEPCPRCKQAVKLPLDQLRHALPPGWVPAAVADVAAAAATPAAAEPAAPAAEAAPPPVAKEKSRHRRAARKPE